MLVLLPIAAVNKRLGGAWEQNSLGDRSSTWICSYKWQTYQISSPCSVAIIKPLVCTYREWTEVPAPPTFFIISRLHFSSQNVPSSRITSLRSLTLIFLAGVFLVGGLRAGRWWISNYAGSYQSFYGISQGVPLGLETTTVTVFESFGLGVRSTRLN